MTNNQELSKHEKFIIACRGYNRTHKKKAGDPSTGSIVRKMSREPLNRLFRTGTGV